MNAVYPPQRPGQQNGAVLLLALIFLIILTLLGVSSMNTSIVETRMATSKQERTYAFQMAEAGLVTGMADLNNRLADVTKFNELRSNLGGLKLADQTSEREMPDGAKYNAVADNITLQYKGSFTPRRGSVPDVYSQTKLKFIYFEVGSSGQNAIGDNAIQINLRRGMRQGAPSGSQ